VSSLERINESDDDTVDGIYPWYPELDSTLARQLTASTLQEPELIAAAPSVSNSGSNGQQQFGMIFDRYVFQKRKYQLIFQFFFFNIFFQFVVATAVEYRARAASALYRDGATSHQIGVLAAVGVHAAAREQRRRLVDLCSGAPLLQKGLWRAHDPPRNYEQVARQTSFLGSKHSKVQEVCCLIG